MFKMAFYFVLEKTSIIVIRRIAEDFPSLFFFFFFFTINPLLRGAAIHLSPMIDRK